MHLERNVNVLERRGTRNNKIELSVTLSSQVIGKFKLYFVRKAVVNVKIMLAERNRRVRTVIKHQEYGQSFVVDAVSRRSYVQINGHVVEASVAYSDTLPGIHVHRSFDVYWTDWAVGNGLIVSLDPLKKLFRVVRSYGKVINSVGSDHGRLNGDAAVGAFDRSYAYSASAVAAAIDWLFRPEQHSVGIVHFEAVSLGLVADNHGTAIVVKDYLVRIACSNVIGVSVSRIVSRSKVHTEESGGVQCTVLGYELFFKTEKWGVLYCHIYPHQ